MTTLEDIRMITVNVHQLKKDLDAHKAREALLVKRRGKFIADGRSSHDIQECSKDLFSVRDKMAKIEIKLGLKPTRRK